MKRFLFRGAILLAAAAAVAWGIDYVYAKLRHAPFADVKVERVLVVQEKFNKVEYDRTDPTTERCVYSLFPHFGDAPCWYLTRHSTQFVKVN